MVARFDQAAGDGAAHGIATPVRQVRRLYDARVVEAVLASDLLFHQRKAVVRVRRLRELRIENRIFG